jgi:phage N-6-adenine-methyltransferase
LIVKPRGPQLRFCSNACRQGDYPRRKKRNVHFRSDTDEWATPAETFADLDREFGPFDLDVCATAENAKCARYFDKKADGLRQRWSGCCWMNPPYGRAITLWVRKAWESVENGDAEAVVCLVPQRCDTGWWHEYAVRGEIRFLRGRLKFGGSANSAPFGSAVVVFRRPELPSA